jgi:3-oxoacyl-[acyl-carrier protein] reductase
MNESVLQSPRSGPSLLPSALSLVGHHIIVTGAASGIGRASAAAIAQLGADLRLVDRSPMDDVRAELEELGSKCSIAQGDLTDAGFLKEVVAVDRLDALVHCAGRAPARPWGEESNWSERFHATMDINVQAPMLLAFACFEKMAAAGGGRIVLMGSLAARNGGSSPNVQPDYAMSKGALHTLIRWLSRQAVGRGVLVNGISPGPVATPLAANVSFDLSSFPMGRLGEPAEIGWISAFLCTPAASYISGSIIDANGGVFVG